jgi:D-sedoheptulose 7-phosphate isomerase
VKDAILRKARESADVKQRFFEEHAERIATCAKAVAAAFDRGARLFSMGNGGSACDAAHVAVELMHPIHEKRPALPAFALAQDPALVTAIGNDEDFALVFSRQLQMLAKPADVALAISTSGKSANLIRALHTAREIGMLTIAFTGRDGGKMPELAEHCFVVPSFGIHRIQETHVTLMHVLWDMIHIARGEEDVIA